MRVLELTLKNFRNIENAVILPSEEMNVICGENAQGKTNLLESIWLFTGCRSFRGAKDSELINFNKPKSLLSLAISFMISCLVIVMYLTYLLYLITQSLPKLGEL